MKIMALSFILILSINFCACTPIVIPLKGTEEYSNSITMDIPIKILESSAGFDTEHVYKVTMKGEGTTIFVYLRSFGTAMPVDPLNVSANTNVQYFQSQKMYPLVDFIGYNSNYGTYRDQVFGWQDGGYISMRTFMLDRKHVVFVSDALDRTATAKMFDSIIPGVGKIYNGLFTA
jgi:hypothetical protein